MNIISKLAAIATALQDIVALIPMVKTELTDLSTFLDTV